MPDRLRVVVVSRAVAPIHGYGGLERHVADLTRHLARRAVDVTLITRTPSEPMTSEEAAAAIVDDGPLAVRFVPYVTFPGAGRRGTTVLDRSTAYLLFGWRAGRLARRLVKSGQAAIVHGLGASVLGYALAGRSARAKAPLVLNPQGLEEFGGTGQRFAGSSLKAIGYAPLRWAVRACAARASAVIATDRSIEPSVRRYLGVGAARLVTIPNAVDLDRCEALAGPAAGHHMRRFVPAGADFILMSVGRLERNKGFHVLAEALASLTSRSWYWVIVGDGPARPQLEQQIAALGLTDRVRLMGRTPAEDLHAWYEASDLFVHPTLYEGSSLVTLEAMAHRRAVIATTAGGLPDKVIPGRTGWLVPPGDAAALTDALREASSRRGSLMAMGDAGRALVEREFSWDAVAERTIALYRQLIAPARTSGIDPHEIE
jgi:glycosyltransferase involved in cell wall biosynthesis